MDITIPGSSYILRVVSSTPAVNISPDIVRQQIRQAAISIVADFDTIDTLTLNPVFVVNGPSSMITVTTNLYDRISRNLETINSFSSLAFKQ